MSGLQNSKLILWPNSNNDKTKKNQIVTKLKKSNFDKTQEKQIVTKLKTQIVTKLKNPNFDQTQKLSSDSRNCCDSSYSSDRKIQSLKL